MKKIYKIIIIIFFIISSYKYAYTEEWYIEKLLNLNYIIEENNIELIKIKYYSFNNSSYNNLYKNLKYIENTLKKEIMKNYKNWKYTYYQVNWIINSYKDFIYYINNLLSLLKIKEKNIDYIDLDRALLNTYTNIRSSFTKIKNLVKD